MTIAIFDLSNQPQTPAWLREHYGIDLDTAIGDRDRTRPGWDLTEIRETEHTCGITVSLLDADGRPAGAVAIARWWPANPGELVELPEQLRTWHTLGLWDLTD